jgi:UDP-N-acetylmuramoyl-tripeptide--D-alanyl-D-alanine ligase
MSIPFSLAELAKWTEGRIAAGDASHALAGVGINTATLGRGELFVAIRGERHDAHDFIPQALEAGAGGLLVERGWLEKNEPGAPIATVCVDDTTCALGALAAGHRKGFTGPLIAITGSNGKTTTKEMCHAILSVQGPCLKNLGNLNNEFGLPLTLLGREPEHRTAVVELGMNHRGEIARLAAIAQAGVGVITNVGTAHIEFLGSQDEIALEKGDLVAALPADGTAVLNADDPRVAAQAKRVRGRVLLYGSANDADVRAEDIRFVSGGAFAFELLTPAGRVPVEIRGLAETTVINALAAAGAAIAAGVSLDDVAEGLGRHDHVPGRMACRALPGGAQIIDDTYNANPQSMQNALETLARLKGAGQGIAVLGDMGELGETAEPAHREAGRQAAELGIDRLFTLGQRAGLLAAGAIEAGMDESRVEIGESHEQVAARIGEILEPTDWVLVKGSRAMRMEQVVDALAPEKD